MNHWVFWGVTFLAGALGAGVGTMMATRGPKSRVTRLETTQRQTVETMIAMTEAIVNLHLGDVITPETKERIRVRIERESEK